MNTTTDVRLKRGKKRPLPKMLGRLKKNLVGYVFVLPVIIGLAFIFIPAMVESLIYSFNDVTINAVKGGVDKTWVALENYNKALNVDTKFKTSLITVITDMVINVPSILVFSYLIANLLNQSFPGRGFARALLFLPVIVSTGIVADIESGDILSLMYGVGTQAAARSSDELVNLLDINSLIGFYQSIGIGTSLLDYVVKAVDRLYYILINSGVQIVIFLSALQSVPQSLYEAAWVEGSSGWEAFWKITFPLSSSALIVNALYTVIDAFLETDSEMIRTIKETMFNRGMYGYGAAMTWLYFIAAGIILSVICFLVSRIVYYEN